MQNISAKKNFAKFIATEERLPISGKNMQSVVLNWLGSVLIARPESIQMPVDFYFAKQERILPTPDEGDSWQKMRFRVYVDRVRVAMIRRISKVILVINIAVLLFTVPVVLVINHVQGKDQATSNTYSQIR